MDPTDPRRLVAEAMNYLTHNRDRMDDPRYRRQELPIASSLVESLVGEFNTRVKGRQKFWNRSDGPEPILQLRAAVLSEDERLDRFFEQRPGTRTEAGGQPDPTDIRTIHQANRGLASFVACETGLSF